MSTTWAPASVTIQVRARVGETWGEPVELFVPRIVIEGCGERIVAFGEHDPVEQKWAMQREITQLLTEAGTNSLRTVARVAAASMLGLP